MWEILPFHLVSGLVPIMNGCDGVWSIAENRIVENLGLLLIEYQASDLYLGVEMRVE